MFNALNKIELRSLEEIRFLMSQFAREPAACLQLLKYLPLNTGAVAERHVRDPELLAFINAECFLWSTVLADATPMISAGMVLCDRFFGGINYPIGGVGEIPRKLAEGLEVRNLGTQHRPVSPQLSVWQITGHDVTEQLRYL